MPHGDQGRQSMNRPAARPMRAKPVQREDAEQRVFAHWMALKHPTLKWNHSPNGGVRNIVVARKLKAAGTSPGFPDIAIYTPPPGLHGVVGVAIELKAERPHHSSVSVEQNEWIGALARAGWATAVCYGARAAIEFVTKYYGG